jgi:hypothetical protein
LPAFRFSGAFQSPMRCFTRKRPWEISLKDVTFQRVVGRGSSGDVWLADWNGLPVAAKTFHTDNDRDCRTVLDALSKEISVLKCVIEGCSLLELRFAGFGE